MEIEAKFVVPDFKVVRKIRAVKSIGNFSLGTSERLIVHDTFFDTPAGALVGTQHVLRVRQRSDGKMFMTFKAPAIKNAAIHRRPETEVKISRTRTPRVLEVSELPARIRALVAPLAHDEMLAAMFSISQVREIRLVRKGRKVIGELSLDRVRFRAGERKREFYELEIELKKAGTVAELQTIVEWVEGEFHLQPVTESKFARGLAFMRGG